MAWCSRASTGLILLSCCSDSGIVTNVSSYHNNVSAKLYGYVFPLWYYQKPGIKGVGVLIWESVISYRIISWKFAVLNRPLLWNIPHFHKTIMYPAYDTPHKLCNIRGNENIQHPRIPPNNAWRPMCQFKCPLLGSSRAQGHPCISNMLMKSHENIVYITNMTMKSHESLFCNTNIIMKSPESLFCINNIIMKSHEGLFCITNMIMKSHENFFCITNMIMKWEPFLHCPHDNEIPWGPFLYY